MTIEDRLQAFEKLGSRLNAIDEVGFEDIMIKVRNENPWFTSDNVKLALHGIQQYLDPVKLREWIDGYQTAPPISKKIAVVMAGNIPLAGFHDFLTVLISGHAILIKLSSKDSALLTIIANKLIEIESRFESMITFADRLKNFDAVIATGSDNSARYFQYYFGKYPHVIRKNRTACAVITGSESPTDLQLLGKDVFTYFGLGCRNVSKIFMNKDYDPVNLVKAWEKYGNIIDHHKYHNNYDYQKSILLVNKIPFYDFGFVILQENEKLVSPITVVYYERYDNPDQLAEKLNKVLVKLQCVVSKNAKGNVPFGQAQSPELNDFADEVNTLKFLESLN